MIAWPIGVALASGLFDHVIVSTDSDEIANVAREYGAQVPFMRPAELSDDITPTAPVIAHALEWVIDNITMPEYTCCIYPTSPFIMPSDLEYGLETMKTAGAPGSLSVTTFEFPILRSFKMLSDGSVTFNWPEYELARSQDLPEFYHDAGQFYWHDAKQLLLHKRLMPPGMRPVVLPRKRVQDLDTPEDWEVAELMATALLREATIESTL